MTIKFVDDMKYIICHGKESGSRFIILFILYIYYFY